jgi:hypothetical protein
MTTAINNHSPNLPDWGITSREAWFEKQTVKVSDQEQPTAIDGVATNFPDQAVLAPPRSLAGPVVVGRRTHRPADCYRLLCVYLPIAGTPMNLPPHGGRCRGNFLSTVPGGAGTFVGTISPWKCVN